MLVAAHAYATPTALGGLDAAEIDRQLMPAGITVNCVNPGPTDTGYAPEPDLTATAGAVPRRPLGHPGRRRSPGAVVLRQVPNDQTLPSESRAPYCREP